MIQGTESIRQAVVESLLADRRVGTADITVEITDHTVRLVGNSPSQVAIDAAEEDARGTRGVDTVQNLIQVRPREELSGRSDADIRRSIQTLLHTVLSTQAPGSTIEVDVRGGTVVLEGMVDSYWARLRAEELALLARGARMVDNKIEVVSAEGISDIQLQDRVRKALRRTGGEALAEVHVTVTGRRATLSGKVADRKGMQLAREIAAKTIGINQVRSELLLA